MAPKRINDEPELTTSESSCAKQFGERVPMFVPPFRKQTNPERQKGERSVDHSAPSVFVPPFKSKVNDSKSPFPLYCSKVVFSFHLHSTRSAASGSLCLTGTLIHSFILLEAPAILAVFSLFLLCLLSAL